MHKSFVALVTVSCLLAPPVGAQDTFLKITIKEGEGALNDVRRGKGADIAVEVRDERDRPVDGAEVTFVAPAVGPGGTYGEGSNTVKVVTDKTGMARTTGYKPNRNEGRYNIKITAAAGERKGTAVVPQVNTAAGGGVPRPTAGGGGGSKTKLIIGLVGAGASVGLLATRLGGGGSSSPSTPPRPPTTLTVGGVTVGGPR